MKQTKQRKNAGAISYVLSFLLSLLLVLLALVGVVSITVCNRAFLKTQVLQTGFCDNVLSELQENYTSYGSASGFSANVMKSFVTVDMIQRDMFQSVDSLYDGKREPIVYPDVQKMAFDVFAADLEQRGIGMTDEIQTAVTQLATACHEDYVNYVRVPFVSYLAGILKKLQQVILWVVIFLLLAIAIAQVVLLLLQRSLRARLRYTTYSFSAGCAACIILPAIALLGLDMRRINISPESIKLLVVGVTDSMFVAIFFFALIYMVVVAALAITARVQYNRYRAFYMERKEDEQYQQ